MGDTGTRPMSVKAAPWDSLYWAEPRRHSIADPSAGPAARMGAFARERERAARSTPGHLVFSPAIVAHSDARRSTGPAWEVTPLPDSGTSAGTRGYRSPRSVSEAWELASPSRTSTASGGRSSGLGVSGLQDASALGVSLARARSDGPGAVLSDEEGEDPIPEDIATRSRVRFGARGSRTSS